MSLPSLATVADEEAAVLDIAGHVDEGQRLRFFEQAIGFLAGDDPPHGRIVEDPGNRGDGQTDLKRPVTRMAQEPFFLFADTVRNGKAE